MTIFDEWHKILNESIKKPLVAICLLILFIAGAFFSGFFTKFGERLAEKKPEMPMSTNRPTFYIKGFKGERIGGDGIAVAGDVDTKIEDIEVKDVKGRAVSVQTN